MWDTIKNDPILRTVTVIFLGFLGFWFVFRVLFGPGQTWVGGGHEGGYGMGMGYQGQVISFDGTIALLLTLIIKLLFIALVIGVIVAIALALKQYVPELKSTFSSTAPTAQSGLTCSKCGSKVDSSFNFCPQCTTPIKTKCPSCGTTVQPGWKCCTNCGQLMLSGKD